MVVFFDIDGTLVAGGYNKTYVPESAMVALKKLREAGHFLAIATGRSQAMAYDYMCELGFENMVSDGGYGVTINGKLVDITPLDNDKVVAVIESIASALPSISRIALDLSVNESSSYVPTTPSRVK